MPGRDVGTRLVRFYQVLASQVRALMMALYRYFQREASLPDPSGPLSESVSPASIGDANDAVRPIIKRPNKPSKSRCSDTHVTCILRGVVYCIDENKLNATKFSSVALQETSKETFQLYGIYKQPIDVLFQGDYLSVIILISLSPFRGGSRHFN